MGNSAHYEILQRGVDAWNSWRLQLQEKEGYWPSRKHPVNRTTPDLSRTSLDFLRVVDNTRFIERFAPLPGEVREVLAELNTDLKLQRYGWKTLDGANLSNTLLSDCDLSGLSLCGANLQGADLRRANLTDAVLDGVNLSGALLSDANLAGAHLDRANLSNAILRDANLRGAVLTRSTMVETDLEGANVSGCNVYGVSAWNIRADNVFQEDLIITARDEPVITVDNLEIAQFLYLLMNNNRLRHAIDSITSRVVLILGRFTSDRKGVLDALRVELRQRGLSPILFDFEVPRDRDITETVTLLARMARFIVADLTDPKSIPQELQAIAPDVLVPILPIILSGHEPWSMFKDLRRKYHWVLPPYEYADQQQLLATLGGALKVAEAKRAELAAP